MSKQSIKTKDDSLLEANTTTDIIVEYNHKSKIVKLVFLDLKEAEKYSADFNCTGINYSLELKNTPIIENAESGVHKNQEIIKVYCQNIKDGNKIGEAYNLSIIELSVIEDKDLKLKARAISDNLEDYNNLKNCITVIATEKSTLDKYIDLMPLSIKHSVVH